MAPNDIIASLKGRTLHIPNLQSVFQQHSWPSSPANPSYAHIAPLVDTTLRQLSSSNASIGKRLNDNLALFTSLWYPTAQKEQLEALALFTVWLICWDDEIDSDEGSQSDNFEKAQQWRQQTLATFKAVLNLSQEDTLPREQDAVNSVLIDFRNRISGEFSQSQRKHVFQHVDYYISCCAREQEFRLGRQIPDFETYMSFREGTVACAMLCSFVDFAQQIHLPGEVAASPERKVLERQVAILSGLVNDLLSFKKELREECVINAVASLITSGSGRTLDDVVVEIVRKMEDAVEVFDEAAGKLLCRVDGAARDLTRDYINGCRKIVTGSLEFT
ncbi:terpene synthase family, metal binding domain-containing protein [Pochonia chlamydosporia 170]|uniref:Terpene synthase n=1 Tax=Pochonia chlamydosporia 170 TaxID=1380566 RepID=A0A179G4R0_METCM|nr:terpene synthase family, metal binding domain-containing protein [Pochonia chlamydosporia 170]OAQ72351.1 terpene synthase family, metal binding domain-containing protein [Pochonia chlamydosporia 170]